MEKQDLIKKYNEGRISIEEKELLLNLIDKGEVEPTELHDYELWLSKSENIVAPLPSAAMDASFYEWLAQAQHDDKQKDQPVKFYWWQAAAAVFILASGVAIGLVINNNSSSNNPQLMELSNEVQEMQEIMMLTLLKQGSASDRLKAVSYTSSIPELNNNIAKELIYTLNNDKNVNVRIATVEALAPYTNNPLVREGLLKSLGKQESPLVQMALLELMVAIREKASVEQMRELLRDNNVTPEVKKKAEESIDILI